MGEGKAPAALACHPLHERRHADQGSCGHHPALLRDGRIHAYPARELLGHRMAHGSNRPALAHHPILLVLCCLPARWRRVPATGEGREHRPIHGQDGIRIAREPGVVQPAHTRDGLGSLYLIITVLALHPALEEVLQDPIP